MKFGRSKISLAIVLLLLAAGVGVYFWWTAAPDVTPAASVGPGERQVNVLTIADWGDDTRDQRKVAASMSRHAASLSPNALQAVISAGDNLYPDLDSPTDADFTNLFEQMYDKQHLGVPFYLTLGNHDYSRGKAPVELEYAKLNPDSRWKLPAKWYRVDLPSAEAPLVTALMLDSNYQELSREDWRAQLKWLGEELEKSRDARWLVVVAHHPLFSHGVRYGDYEVLIRTWGTLFRQHEVDFYVFGHDHFMQHLEIPGYLTSFVGCGGGGGTLHDVKRDGYGPFAREAHGFAHIRFGEQSADVNYLDRNGKPMHAFSRPVNLRRRGAAPVISAEIAEEERKRPRRD